MPRVCTHATLLRRAADPSNTAAGIEYTRDFLRLLLLAHSDASGHVEPKHDVAVRGLFDARQAWKLATEFRSAWCAITDMQVALMTQSGWTDEQIDKFNQAPGPPGVNPLAMLFLVWLCVCVSACVPACPRASLSHLRLSILSILLSLSLSISPSPSLFLFLSLSPCLKTRGRAYVGATTGLYNFVSCVLCLYHPFCLTSLYNSVCRTSRYNSVRPHLYLARVYNSSLYNPPSLCNSVCLTNRYASVCRTSHHNFVCPQLYQARLYNSSLYTLPNLCNSVCPHLCH